jgi:dihydropteroate synthase
MNARARFELRLPSRSLKMGHRTLIMGVLNVTPDSFYDGGRYFKFEKAINRGMQLEAEGADILDIGGESTRPLRSGTVTASEEMKRVVPVIERLVKCLSIPISVDTSKAEVARAALAAGAQIVNDISGFRFDAGMPTVVAASKAAVVLMHSRGTPESMHRLGGIRHVMRVVLDGLRRAVHKAVKAGVHRNRIIVDPGLGFGKQPEDNLLLLKKLDKLTALRLPVLVGASRKSFVGKILEVPPAERLSGSLVCAALAIFSGAHILRVHDVRETLQVAKICDAVMNSSR